MPFSVLRLNLQSSHLEPLAQSPNNLTGRNKTHARFYVCHAESKRRTEGRSAASNNSKTAADRLRHNALLPHWGEAWSPPIPVISPVHVAAANSNLKTRAKIPQPDHPCTFSSAKTAGTFIQLSNELVKTLADQLADDHHK
jgi:hypothetical protein